MKTINQVVDGGAADDFDVFSLFCDAMTKGRAG